MTYLVLARKWRPSAFEDVVGQHHITQTLRNAVAKDRVPHALLFSGSRGIGKTSCARILAKALNCETGPTPTPCGVCNTCVEIASGRSIDVFEIDGASNNSVEQIREIRESVKFVPTAGRRKVYIIDEVHMLSVSAFNALLKTLEEPPEHVLFIFATTEPHKIPDTILSRCQRFDFRRIPEKEIVGALAKIAGQESVTISEGLLSEIAREARGGMRDSLSLLDQVISFCGELVDEQQARQVLGIAGRAQLANMFTAIKQRNGQQVLEFLTQQHQQGTDLEKYAHRFVDFIRDLLVVRVCPEPQRLLDQESDELSRMSALVEGLQPADLHRMLGTLLRHVDELARSAFPRLRLEMALLEICEQGPTVPIADLLDAVQNARQLVAETDKKKTVTPESTVVVTPVGEVASSTAKMPVPSVSKPAPPSVSQPPASPLTQTPSLSQQNPAQDVASRSEQPSVSTPVVRSAEKAPAVSKESSKPPTKPSSAQSDNKGASFKKRPSKRSGGYDDFSATPPKPWTEEKCPELDVKPRRPGASAISGEADASSAPPTGLDRTYQVAEFVSKGETAQERYRQLLLVLKSMDTFLASELEQNSHIISFDEAGAQIAIEGSEASLIARASLGLHQVFGTSEGEESGFTWVRCEVDDGRLSTETIFEERQRHAAALLAKRKHDAEDHEAIHLAKQILGGQVLDVLPREQ